MSDFPRAYLIGQLETATLEALGDAVYLGTWETDEQRRAKARAFLLECVEAALAGDPHMAKALMQIIAWLHRDGRLVPAELGYYVHEAFARIVVDGDSADRAFGLAIGHAPGAHPHAREYRYGRLVARVDALRAEGHKDYMIWELIAAEGLPALDGSGTIEHPKPSSIRKEHAVAREFHDKQVRLLFGPVAGKVENKV